MDILHPKWKNCEWNVSGFLSNDFIIQDFIMYAKALSNDPDLCPIKSVHGSPAASWNSGRAGVPLDDPNIAFNAIREYNAANVGVYLTFSRTDIINDDLTDAYCNDLLELLNSNPINGVILSSDILYNHIKKNFQNLKLTASILKATAEGAGSIDYYLKQEDRFDRVVLHPDDIFNKKILEALSPDKFEIIVNENCLRDCKVRQQHYNLLGQIDQNPDDVILHRRIEQFSQTKCKSEPTSRQIKYPFVRNCNLTIDELAYIYDMGYRQFKLQGRTDNPHQFVYDICRYILEPDFAAPLVCKSL